MPLVQTRGAASAQGFGEFAQVTAANYIEDMFSCFLYTGNSSTQVITNGIDLAGKGGMVWIKSRNGAIDHRLVDSARTAFNTLYSNSSGAESTSGLSEVSAFNSTGFTVESSFGTNNSSYTYASWTFRKQPKFFDVVTYTGTGSNRTVPHALDSVPGCIIVKRTDTTANWAVYHRSLANTQYLVLNSTAAAATGATWWNSTTPTSAVFSLGTDASVNASGGTYVAYIYAHDAGGFGLSGTDNVISCGSFTTNGSGVATVNLGYEPQFVLFKRTDSAGHSWEIIDTMRGFSINSNGTGGNVQRLNANSSGAETNSSAFEMYLTSTGFATDQYFYNATYIYIAIRRGPMKVPTLGTSVYEPQLYTGNGGTQTVTGPTNAFQYDSLIQKGRSVDLTGYAGYGAWTSKLQNMSTVAGGSSRFMGPAITNAETAGGIETYTNVGFTIGGSSLNTSGTPYVNYWLRRAPSFFDVVCYTGTGANRTVTHNLAAVPELMIVKRRNNIDSWFVYQANNTGSPATQYLNLDGTYATSTYAQAWNNTLPTSSVFTVGTESAVNANTSTYVAYLFATCAGVSKVGSYTGTGAAQTINCGFTAGSRFVMIKRTDSTGDWYVWDSARGIVAGNDPHLSLNTTAAEVTTDDSVDTDSTGFVVNQVAATNINVTSATYIFLAVS